MAKIWRVTVVSTGDDVVVDLPEAKGREDAREEVFNLFHMGVWKGNTYTPSSQFLSANIEEVEVS